MFAYLKGHTSYGGKDFVVIEVNGIGYKVHTANPYEFKKGEVVQVFTHQVVSENEISLYGFRTLEEHDLFINLAQEKEVKNGRIMYPVRVALTFKSFTPGGAVEIAHILGKNESLKRINLAIKLLSMK